MATFRYRAKDGAQTVTGSVEAQNKTDAIRKIHGLGYVPVLVEEAEDAVSAGSSGQSPLKFSSRKIRSKDITVFTRQLSSLLKSGVPILRSLQILSRQSENSALKTVIEDVQLAVKDGKTLSSALSAYPQVFPPLYLAMVRSGESAGTMEEILSKIADHRQKQEAIASHIRSALAYPMLMVFVGIGTIIFMFAFVMPRMMETFSSLDQALPLPTQMMVGLHDALAQSWKFVVVAIGALVLMIQRGMKSDVKNRIISRVSLKLPVIRDFVRKSELARFCRTMEMLLKSNIPVLNALETAIPIVGNNVLRTALAKSCGDLKEGGSLGRSLEESKVLPVFMTSLIVVGEESGRLAEGMGEIADAYTRDTEEMVKLITSLMEPAIILVMGLVVGFIVIAMLLPIFQVNFMAG